MSRSGVREAVSSCLSAVLDAGGEEERRAAEEEMKALEVTEEFGAVLAELTASTDVALPYRQLASVLLKQYVESHWNSLSEKFCEPVPDDHVKTDIRRLLMESIGDKEKRLRGTVAYAIAAIAHWDWPEQWPELFPQLVTALSSGAPAMVHGSMRILSEFCHDISDSQVSHVAPVMLPQLLRIILQPQTYSVRTQSRAVHIFHTLCSIVYTMSETAPQLVSSLLLPALPDYLAAFVQVLGSGEEWAADPGLRREVLMALSSLLQWFPHAMQPHVMDLVTPVWNIFLTTTPLYVQSVVNSETVLTDVVDSDGETLGQEASVFAIFEFISVLSESRRLQRLLPPILPTLCHLLITHMQVTEEQVHSWLADVAQFVEDDENEFSYSVRLSAQDLLQSMGEEPGLADHTHLAIVSAVEKHLQGLTPHSSPHWWKVQEACLLALGSLVEAAKAGSCQFDAQQFTESIILPTLSTVAYPLLLGRCLWLAGKMSSLLKPDTVTHLLQSLVSALLPSQHTVLRMLAAKATFYFCSELRGTESASLLVPFLPSLLSCLTDLAADSADAVLLVVVDALQLTAQIDDGVTAQLSERLSAVAMSLFLKHSHDPGVTSTLEDLFSVLAKNPGCLGNLQARFLPTAIHLLESNDQGLSLSLLAAVLDVLVVIVRGCGVGGVPDEVVQEVFPRVVRRALASDDSAILQNAGECVRAFVATSAEQLARWVDASGHSGLGYVVQLVVHLLDPARPEFSAAFVGKLIITFIKKAGPVLGDHLQLLLRSVLSKMHCVETSSVMQSLLVVFTHLIQTELEAVVVFLSQVPDPQGEPALNFVLREWCTQHPFFFGMYETRVSTMALCHLLSHYITSGDDRLGSVHVVEELPSVGEGILTRSKKAAAAPQRTKVTLPVKIVKLLISDLQNQMESTAGEEEEEQEEEEEEGEEGSEGLEQEGEAGGALARDMEAMLSQVEPEQWAEVEDDPDLQDEPVLKLDLQAHLVRYLTELSQQSCFHSFLPHLSPHEVETLHAIGIHC